jgi:CubicO group peptidase (beta-lactamase class C family)
MNAPFELSRPEDVGMSQERLDRLPKFFQSYLDQKRLSCMSLLVARHGQIVHHSCQGVKDWDTGEALTPDTIFRIYSMSKPITSVALMMLYEQGLFRLEHEVGRYIPEFRDVQVFDKGDHNEYTTRAPDRPMNIRDVLTHTSGLTYDFMVDHPVDKIYRRTKLRGLENAHLNLEEFVSLLAKQPLVFSPGTQWNYSFSTDVCGRLVEIISGMPLDEYFEKQVFAPLGMVDTGFLIDSANADRIATNYERDPKTKEVRVADSGKDSAYLKPRAMFSGGGGLASTMHDYFRFAQMLLNGGELEGTRVLSPTTVDFMSQNHLPGGATLADLGMGDFSESLMEGEGFGLGFSVVTDPVAQGTPSSAGTFSWGGAASTHFFVDPVEELVCIQMTQLMPSGTYPIRQQFQQLAYASVID